MTKFKLTQMTNDIEEHIDLDNSIKNAFLSLDREIFVPSGFRHLAYKLDALPMEANQWISSPLTVAYITQHLELETKVDSILEIGCGSGYQAGILSYLSRRVFTIERIGSVLHTTKDRFRSLSLMNIISRFDDGQNGWMENAPYDRIVLSATIDKVPDILFSQLIDDGILIAPIKVGDKEFITKYSKNNNIITSHRMQECRFVPILDGREK